MLHLLPTELLILIIELTLPPDYAVSRYAERQEALRSYSLICREVRQVAQPLLWRVFRADEVVEEVVSAQPDKLKHIRRFEAKEDVMDCKDVIKWTSKMQDLVELRLLDYRDALVLSSSGIHHLVLSNLRLAAVPLFASLTSLTLHHVHIWAIDVDFASSFPSLRALYTRGRFQQREGRVSLLECPSLHPQLDMLQVHVDEHELFATDLLQQTTLPVLLTIYFDDMNRLHKLAARLNPEHLQLIVPPADCEPDEDEPDEEISIDHLLATLQLALKKLSRLSYLSLPALFHPSISSDLAQVEPLLSLCESRSIRIVWRLDSFTDEDDLGVSHEFWAYAKRLKAKKVAEAVASSEGA